MEMTLTLNPDDRSDLARAIAVLERLSGAQPSDRSDDQLRDRVRSILRGYGDGRLNYVRVIAEAAPERVPVERIVALFDSPRAVGGTHSSIERSWRSLGGATDFIDTNRHGDARMDPDLAAVVLDVLAEL